LSDFQFNGTTLTGLPAAFNTAKARSRGAEIETEMLLTQRLRATLAYTYTQATIRQSQTFYDLGFCGQPQCVLYDMQAGSRLPGVPKQTLTVAADYKVSLPAMGHADAFVNFHADSAYHGSSPGTVNHAATLSDGTPNKQALLFWEVPASVVTNARITLDGGSGWSAEMFINNVTSATAYSGASLTQELPTVYSTRNVTRPRTVGIDMRYRF
jgi:outer membrane receptor for Fe3+-dicitrate